MKDLLKITVLFAAFVFIIPLAGYFGRPESSETAEKPVEKTDAAEIPTDSGNFKIFDITSGHVSELPMRDYIIGSVMAQMPAAYEPEALKAQTVLAYTYALRRIMQETQSPDTSLMGAYISNDTSLYQAYFTPEQGKAFYGEAYDEYYEKTSSAVDAVFGEVLYYGGEPVCAAFHSVSCGRTENSADAWDAEFPYLVSVESGRDSEAPNFYSEASFTSDEIKAAFPDAEFSVPGISADGFTEGGCVRSAHIGNTVYTGREVRDALGLKSACFSVTFKDGLYVFSVKGSGHGVGMSQYGANVMAKEGRTYREILEHYFPGTKAVLTDN